MSDVLLRSGLPDFGAVDAIIHARHGDPFSILGPHVCEGGCAVRSFQPGATAVEVIAADSDRVLGTLDSIDPAGFWSGVMPSAVPYRLRISVRDDVRITEDPYAFGPSLGEVDIYLLAEGRHREIGRTLGAHIVTQNGVVGTRFAVWAPNARRVSVVGSFNRWDGRCHPMRHHPASGIWEMFIPRLGAGTLYKYEILGPDGYVLPLKADPVASCGPGAAGDGVHRRGRPFPVDRSCLGRGASDWLRARRMPRSRSTRFMPVPGCRRAATAAMSGHSWRRSSCPTRRAWASRISSSCRSWSIPSAGSWGYQPLGQFAPSARLGSPENFARLVDRCHQAGLGVILDWVPAHFPGDAHGLFEFDGTHLYEHSDPKEGFHQDWNTYIYNLGRNEVRGFLIGSALHWLEHYHVDALRVDAVASMLYRDYSRKQGEWVPNIYGGRENLESVSFLRELSEIVGGRCPGALLIAEESTAWPGVSRPVNEGGLGFDYKWNMGWMHDSLHYMEEESDQSPLAP